MRFNIHHKISSTQNTFRNCINTKLNQFFYFTSYTNLNYKDPGDSLLWLWDVLLLAEASNEKVHIIGHSPPNTKEYISGWARQYTKIIDR